MILEIKPVNGSTGDLLRDGKVIGRISGNRLRPFESLTCDELAAAARVMYKWSAGHSKCETLIREMQHVVDIQ